jgi:hypothetical protein
MHSIVFWVSIMEIVLLIIGVFLFFSYPSDMAYIFIHILHPARGILGLVIASKLPKSHEIVEFLDLKSIKGKLDFSEFREKITQKLKDTYTKVDSEMKAVLKAYFILSIIIILPDLFQIII